MSKLHLGYKKSDKSSIEIPVNTLRRHFVALGASGSGKTVLVKVILEECIRNNLPLVVVDIQGDLASLALMGDKKLAQKKGTPPKYWDEVKRKAEVAIFTPASSKGVPMSMNPLKAPPKNIDPEELIQNIDTVAETLTSLAGYNSDKGKGANVHSYLYLLLKGFWQKSATRRKTDRLEDLIEAQKNEKSYLTEKEREILDEKEKVALQRALLNLTIGADSLIFNLGIPLDISTLLAWPKKDKVPVNVLFLNTIRDEETRNLFLANFTSQVYNYMIQNPSRKLQLVVLLDELAGLVPPVSNPPTKKSIQLLMKQARKFGIAMLLATQNISDVDYKSLGQVGTWALGRMITKQDIEKVKGIIEAISPNETERIIRSLRSLKTGEFMLLCPDVFSEVQHMNVRWLVTEHLTLDDDYVKDITDKSGLRERFTEFLPKKETEKVSMQKPDREPKSKMETTALTQESVKTSPKKTGLAPEKVDKLKEAYQPDVEDKFAAVPAFLSLEDVPKKLEKIAVAVNAEEVASVLDEPKKKISRSLNDFVKQKKLDSGKVGKKTVYWSPKHKMDPKNNLVGLMFKLNLRIIQGQAEKIVKKKIPRAFSRHFQEIREIILKYIPLWRIPLLRDKEIKIGGFLRKQNKWITEREVYYLHGISGGILSLSRSGKDPDVEFLSQGIESAEKIRSLPDNLILDEIKLQSVKEGVHVYPKLNRDKAESLTNRLLGGRTNPKVTASIIWYPIYTFKKHDKELNKVSLAWVDGIYGTYYQDYSPIDLKTYKE